MGRACDSKRTAGRRRQDPLVPLNQSGPRNRHAGGVANGTDAVAAPPARAVGRPNGARHRCLGRLLLLRGRATWARRVLATDYYCWSGPGWGTKAGFELARRTLGSSVEDQE